jgi:uncharacterized protein with HEPN domain
MLDAARDALSFAEGKSRGDLDRDRGLLLAVVQCDQIIGEAAGRVSAPRQSGLPGIPWPAIIGMRNRLVHAYYDIDRDQVWKTVTEDLPPLVGVLKRALGEP